MKVWSQRGSALERSNPPQEIFEPTLVFFLDVVLGSSAFVVPYRKKCQQLFRILSKFLREGPRSLHGFGETDGAGFGLLKMSGSFVSLKSPGTVNSLALI